MEWELETFPTSQPPGAAVAQAFVTVTYVKFNVQ